VDRIAGREIRHHDRVHPLAQHVLRLCRVVAPHPDEVGEGSQDRAPEAPTSTQQRRGRRREADVVALQLLERSLARRRLGQRLLGRPAVGPEPRLVLPRLRHRVP
jgi:hypothetical protein